MYTIGKLARRARVNPDSIRFYERQRLVFPTTKTEAGYRLYDDEAVRRIAFIKHAQRCGFSLAEIGELLAMHSGDASARADGYRLAIAKQTEIASTVEALESMSEALSQLISACEDNADTPEDGISPLLTALETHISEQDARRNGNGHSTANALHAGSRVEA